MAVGFDEARRRVDAVEDLEIILLHDLTDDERRNIGKIHPRTPLYMAIVYTNMMFFAICFMIKTIDFHQKMCFNVFKEFNRNKRGQTISIESIAAPPLEYKKEETINEEDL